MEVMWMKGFWEPRKLWIVFLVFSGTFINAIDRSSISTANTFMAKDLHLSMTTMGMVLSAFGWTYLLFNIPFGWLCDRIGVKKVYGLAAAIWSVASACTGLAKGVGILLVSRLFVGVGEAANFPAATQIMTNTFPEKERGTATGIYLAGLRLGFAVTPMIMIGLMLAYGTQGHPNWRIAFYLTGIGSLVWVLLWFLTFRDPRMQGVGIKSSAAPSTATHASTTRTMSTLALLKFRNTWAIICIKFFQDYLYYLFLTWLPAYLIKARHFDLPHIAFYATLPWIAGMISQPLIGMLSDWLIKKGYDPTKVKKSLLIIVQIIAAVIIAAGYIHSALAAAWLIVVATAAESASTAILWTIPADLAPTGSAGSLGGIMNTAGALAAIVSPALTGFIAQVYGFAVALLLSGCMMIAAALCVLFFLKRIQPLKL